MNRINIPVAGSSPTAQADRDGQIAEFQSLFSTSPWKFRRYNDTNSGLGIWSYTASCYAYTAGILTAVTITCSGMVHPPSGSNLAAALDPGPGNYTWTQVGAPPKIETQADWNSGKSTPNQNPNFWIWPISGNSPTAPADFTNAVSKIQNDTSLVPGYWKYYRYDDAVSGAWEVSAVCMFLGSLPQAITFIVTCSGTPNPPTGSQVPAVPRPPFTQTFITLSAPLALGPGR